MKKILVLIAFSLIFTLCLAACDQGTEQPEDTTAAMETEAPTTEELTTEAPTTEEPTTEEPTTEAVVEVVHPSKDVL